MSKKYTDSDILESLEKKIDFEKNELGISPTYGYKTGLKSLWLSATAKKAKVPNSMNLN